MKNFKKLKIKVDKDDTIVYNVLKLSGLINLGKSYVQKGKTTT